MKNLSSEHSKNRKTIDYLIDIPCDYNKCTMCYLKSMEFGSIPKKSTDTIINDIKILEDSGFSIYTITSDLLMHQDWKKIIQATKKEHILTTGYPLVNNKDMINEIRDLGIKQIVMSTNLPEYAKKLKLPEEPMVRYATNISKKAGLSVMLAYIINSQNYKDSLAMMKHAKSIGADSIRFFQYLSDKDKNLVLNTWQEKRFIQDTYDIQAKGIFKKEELYISRENFPGSHNNKGAYCTAGINRFTIGLDNNIYPCIFLIKPQFIIGKFDSGIIDLEESYQEKIPFLDSEYCKAKEYCKKTLKLKLS